jgi:hypothetical protein
MLPSWASSQSQKTWAWAAAIALPIAKILTWRSITESEAYGSGSKEGSSGAAVAQR